MIWVHLGERGEEMLRDQRPWPIFDIRNQFDRIASECTCNLLNLIQVGHPLVLEPAMNGDHAEARGPKEIRLISPFLEGCFEPDSEAFSQCYHSVINSLTIHDRSGILHRMKAADLKRWMDKNGKTAVDVASMSKVSLQTVDRFLKGSSVRPVVLAAFERLVRESSAPEPADTEKVATG